MTTTNDHDPAMSNRNVKADKRLQKIEIIKEPTNDATLKLRNGCVCPAVI